MNLIEEMIELKMELVTERSEHGKTMEQCGIKGIKHSEEIREVGEKLEEEKKWNEEVWVWYEEMAQKQLELREEL